MFKFYFVNAPGFFTFMWGLISPLIDENTRKKMKILGNDFKKELLEYVDEDQLP